MNAEELAPELLRSVKEELRKQQMALTGTYFLTHSDYARAKGVAEGIEKSLAAMGDVVARYKKSIGDT